MPTTAVQDLERSPAVGLGGFCRRVRLRRRPLSRESSRRSCCDHLVTFKARLAHHRCRTPGNACSAWTTQKAEAEALSPFALPTSSVASDLFFLETLNRTLFHPLEPPLSQKDGWGWETENSRLCLPASSAAPASKPAQRPALCPPSTHTAGLEASAGLCATRRHLLALAQSLG